MELACPTCSTKYRIPTAQVRPGQKVRCRRCKTVFPVAPDKPETGTLQSGGQSAHEAMEEAAAAEVFAAAEADEAKLSDDSDSEDSEDSYDDGFDDPYDIGLGVASGPATSGESPPSPETETDPFDNPDAPNPEATEEDPFADPADAEKADGRPDWMTTSAAEAEPNLDPQPEPDDPFEAPDLPEAAPVSRTASPERSGERAVGMSAIRAQQQVATGDIPAGIDDIDDSGWLVRGVGDSGEPQSFRDLEAVRAWLSANPDAEVEVSSDGSLWRPPDVLLGIEIENSATSRVGAPMPTGVTSALTAPPPSNEIEAISPPGLWMPGAVASTLMLVIATSLMLQTTGWANLSGVLPFEAVGLGAIVGPEGEEGDAGAAPVADTPGAKYKDAIQTAREAQAAQRFFAAAVSYRRALTYRESPEALEGLADMYELLGDSDRERRVRARLKKVRTEIEKATP